MDNGYAVRALDNLCMQFHTTGPRPACLDKDVELVVGDLRNPSAVSRALRGVGGVVHLGAAVGVGQSMYQLKHYTDVNNIGSGREHTVSEVARDFASVMNKDIEPEIAGYYRTGDIRHCYADIGKAREVLGYEPQVDFGSALGEFAEWLEGQTAEDRGENACEELVARGLAM